MLRRPKLWDFFKTNKLINYNNNNNNNSFDKIICFLYVALHFKTKINSAPVLKYNSGIMMTSCCARKEIILP